MIFIPNFNKLWMQGANKMRSTAHAQVCINEEVAAQRRRWTSCVTIKAVGDGGFAASSQQPLRIPSGVGISSGDLLEFLLGLQEGVYRIRVEMPSSSLANNPHGFFM